MTESQLQQNCVKWFKCQYRELDTLFFAVPNGGYRHIATATRMKKEGVKSGVADLILLVARNGYHSLCIEMKFDKGVQTESQKKFQVAAESEGNLYVVCRNLDEFMNTIKNYLNEQRGDR